MRESVFLRHLFLHRNTLCSQCSLTTHYKSGELIIKHHGVFERNETEGIESVASELILFAKASALL